jgi:murein DD-endopeptidase MepM/ murein hydrolase activator NlpD
VATPASAAGTWSWPVSGPVIRAFDPPDSPFGSGHRGIDIAAPAGSDAVAPAAGVVVFAGPVGGRLFVTIDHGGGLESTFSWVESIDVRRGDVVAAGQVVATTGSGHAGDIVPNLHFGVRLDDVYVDPLDHLSALELTSLIRLAPLAA